MPSKVKFLRDAAGRYAGSKSMLTKAAKSTGSGVVKEYKANLAKQVKEKAMKATSLESFKEIKVMIAPSGKEAFRKHKEVVELVNSGEMKEHLAEVFKGIKIKKPPFIAFREGSTNYNSDKGYIGIGSDMFDTFVRVVKGKGKQGRKKKFAKAIVTHETAHHVFHNMDQAARVKVIEGYEKILGSMKGQPLTRLVRTVEEDVYKSDINKIVAKAYGKKIKTNLSIEELEVVGFVKDGSVESITDEGLGGMYRLLIKAANDKVPKTIKLAFELVNFVRSI